MRPCAEVSSSKLWQNQAEEFDIGLLKYSRMIGRLCGRWSLILLQRYRLEWCSLEASLGRDL